MSWSKWLSLSLLLCPCCQLWASHTGFWASTDFNPSSSIWCFHFDHNLKDSHRRIFWVILMTLGLSKALDFITISVCFRHLACAEVKAQEVVSCFMKKYFFSVVSIEKRGRGSKLSCTFRVWACQTQKPGPSIRYHVNVTSGTPSFTCQLVTFVRSSFNSCTL